MRLARLTRVVSFLLVWNAPAIAQDVTLSKDCEEGFRRLMHLAQGGQLGDDVSNANIGIAGNQVRLELVRTGAPNKQLLLTPKRSPHEISRYFDVAAGDGATASDVERVGRALDDVFRKDPFHVLGVEGPPTGDPIPSLTEAWAYGGWRGVLRVCERRMMVLAGLEYTIAVIVALAFVSLASLVLLWASIPPRLTAGARGSR